MYNVFVHVHLDKTKLGPNLKKNPYINKINAHKQDVKSDFENKCVLYSPISRIE